jgi:hypothetical protein
MKPHSLHVKINLLLLLRLMIVLMAHVKLNPLLLLRLMIVLMAGFKVMESEVMRSILVMLNLTNIVLTWLENSTQTLMALQLLLVE